MELLASTPDGCAAHGQPPTRHTKAAAWMTGLWVSQGAHRGQPADAVVLALLLRADLPVAALATLVTNPVTFAPIFVLAYRTGAAVLGEQEDPEAARALALTRGESSGASADDAQPRWIERARAVGKPLFLGLAIFAVLGSLATWVLVRVAWMSGVWLKRRRRLGSRR